MSIIVTGGLAGDRSSVRTWDVLLIGGASGTGKTSISYQLARHFDVGITEIDDFQVILEHMTTPEQQPVLHYWRTHPEAVQLPPESIVDLTVSVAETMAPAIEAVIQNHLESNTPVLLEGDYLLPATAARTNYGAVPNGGRVRAVFLFEADEEQIATNYSRREPAGGTADLRSRVSFLYGNWLRTEARRYGVPVVEARPWDSLLDRVTASI
jgi:2-phosphoglycerate kinase